eukprot:2526755-Amphidinium_carterae.5
MRTSRHEHSPPRKVVCGLQKQNTHAVQKWCRVGQGQECSMGEIPHLMGVTKLNAALALTFNSS